MLTIFYILLLGAIILALAAITASLGGDEDALKVFFIALLAAGFLLIGFFAGNEYTRKEAVRHGSAGYNHTVAQDGSSQTDFYWVESAKKNDK